jgi:hypothetical protein
LKARGLSYDEKENNLYQSEVFLTIASALLELKNLEAINIVFR